MLEGFEMGWNVPTVGFGFAVLFLVWKVVDYLVTKYHYDGWVGFLLRFRWIPVTLIVLPVGKIMHVTWKLRQWYYDAFLSRPEMHEQRVRDIQQRVREFNQSGGKGFLCTARPQWLRVQMRIGEYQKNNNTVPIELYDILDLDEERRIVRTEPVVNMAQITEYLLPKGWTLPLVPELDELTVGGLICGYGMETSAHKCGLFADTVEAIEIVTGDGELVRCSRTQNADLFHAIPWSYGALGFLVAVELRVIPAKPYVRVQYFPYRSRDAMCQRFREEAEAENPCDFLEGIFYTPEEGVVAVGTFASREEALASGNINDVSLWYKPWYYTHIESMLHREGVDEETPYEEFMPIRTYYHRHSRSIFWEGELILPFGNHWLFRWLFGWLYPLHVGLLKLTQGKKLQNYYYERHVCQDALVPMHKLEEGVEFFHENWECYPLWICPHLTFKTEPEGLMRPENSNLKPGESEMWVDIGAWFVPGPVFRKEPFSGTQARKNFERWLIDNGGYQCLYAVTEMTREQWRQMFHPQLYDRVRKKYGSEGVFMDAFDKVRRR